MKFRYFLGFSVSLELTLGDYCFVTKKKKRKKVSIQCQIKTLNFVGGTNNFPECGDLYHPDSDMGHASHHYSHSARLLR